MVASVRDSIATITAGASGSIDVDYTGLTHSTSDILYLFVCGYTSIETPVDATLTWTQRLSDSNAGPFGVDVVAKVFTAVSDGSADSFTLAVGLDDQYAYAFVSVQGVDFDSPVDGTPGISSEAFGTVANPTAPSISPTGSDSLLICAVSTWPSNGAPAGSHTPPGDLTEREDWDAWDYGAVATAELVASGATGTKVFTESGAEGGTSAWIAASIAIKTATVEAFTGTLALTQADQTLAASNWPPDDDSEAVLGDRPARSNLRLA